MCKLDLYLKTIDINAKTALIKPPIKKESKSGVNWNLFKLIKLNNNTAWIKTGNLLSFIDASVNEEICPNDTNRKYKASGKNKVKILTCINVKYTIFGVLKCGIIKK